MKKGIFMRWVKKTIQYWCDDIIEEKHLGSGIRVGILDTGIVVHPDLQRRICEFRDFTCNRQRTCYDDSGHGTHVAGILAGEGRASRGMYSGIAPDTDLFIGKVLDRYGNGNVEDVLNGIQWMLSLKREKNLKIVNISVGAQPDLGEEQKKKFLDAVDEMWDAGLTVIVSAGNYGPSAGSIAVPGNSRKVITVGVPDSFRYNRNYRKKTDYSGRGPTSECIIKPDVFAPGTGIVSCNSRFSEKGEPFYVMKSGTSMATPVISGAIACLLSKYPDMTNVEIKLRLRETCVDYPGTEAGWGLLNVKKLMNA